MQLSATGKLWLNFLRIGDEMFRLIVFTLTLLTGTTVLASYIAPIAVEKSIVEIHVKKDWTVRNRSEQVSRVETERGIDLLGEQKIQFNSAHEKVRVISAYTIQPDGSRDKVTEDRIRIQDDIDDLGNGIYSTSKLLVIIFPNLRVGSKTYYQVESLEHTPDFPGNFSWTKYYSPHKKYDQAEIRFSHAPSLDIKVETKGLTGGRTTPKSSSPSDPIRYHYRYNQDQALPYSRNLISHMDYAPRFAASSFKTYADVAVAYQTRAKSKAAVTTKIRNLANELVGSSATDLEKVKKLYAWVSNNIRSSAVYAGNGGYVPNPAQRVLESRYGDCKDHATLLQALLRAVGVESSQVLINSENAFNLPDPPSFAVFDHVINYVPALDLFLDSTSRFTPVGTLPQGVVGKPALIVSTGEVKATPIDTADSDSTNTVTQMVLHEDGRVTGSTKITQSGYFQIDSRAKAFQSLNKAQEEVVSSMLARFNESGRGRIKIPDPRNLDADWVIDADFNLEPMVTLPGVAAFTFPVGLAQGRFQMLAGTKLIQNSPIPQVCGSASHREAIKMALPANARITRVPPDASFQTKSLNYTATYRVMDGAISVVRSFSLELGKSVCGKDDALEWARFTIALQRDLRQQFFLEYSQ